uniref:Uncharacterized protein n=1 Tax=Anguilla anguilla TaxID=7936 RepID=A0A0E9QMN4_ANGAN
MKTSSTTGPERQI